MRRPSLLSLATSLALSLAPSGLAAQLPTTQQEAMRMLEQNPEALRQALLRSGMTQAEIRSRLAAAGIPADALDDFLTTPPGGTLPTTLDPAAMSALQELGIVEQTADGVELVPVTAGMQRREPPATGDELPLFGHDVFTRSSTLFQPLLYGPVPDEYRLGPGDQLVLVITGEVELARELVVTRDGFIVIPDVGQVSVTNLTLGGLRALLEPRLARVYSGIGRGTASFEVTVTQVRTIQVYVSGEVAQASAYQLASVATVMNALYAAGGPTVLGNLRDVRVRRRSGEEISLDLYPYLLEGNTSGDVGLEQGDVVFVPLKGRRVKVTGAVRRPREYELSESDDLVDVFRAAGGFSSTASRERLTIHRISLPADRGPGLTDRVAIDLGLRTAADATDPASVGGVTIPPVGLQDGDSIVVHPVPALSQGYYVSIVGMVARPDTFPWREGMTIRDLVLLARGPTVGADLRQAEVSRMPTDRSGGDLAERLRVPLDSSYLSQRDAAGRYVGPPGVPFPRPGTAPEFILEPFDNVLILRQPDFEMPRTVKITGEVRVPGEYTLLSKEDRVTDLVERADGMLPTAYPQGARLVRREDQLGRIDMDLPMALAGRGSENDLILQPGDSLHIPVYSPTVVVRGAVNSPVAVLYQPGESFDYYIANAGGFRNDADRGRASVRYANGQAQTRSRFLFWSSYPSPGPGSVINVPAKDPGDRLDTRGLITDLVAIAGSLTTMIVVIVANSN